MRRSWLLTLVVLASAGDALGAELSTVGDGAVRETECTYEVHLDGLIARVTERHRFVGTADAAEAAYAFSLPPGAAIVGLTVAPPGVGVQRGAAVDATGAVTAAADRDTVAVAADLGLVRRLGALDEDLGDVAYELRAWPVGPKRATTVELTWVAPLAVVDGRLALRVPGRGSAPHLADAKGTVRASPPAGVKKLRALRAAGDLIAAKPGKKPAPFTAPQVGDLWIEVTPVLGTPLIAFSTAPLADDRGALALALLRPRAAESASRFDRVLFVVDGSLSAAGEPAARDAIASVVDGVARRVGDAEVQALVFDRTTRTLLPSFTRPTETVRTHVHDALAGLTPAAGSDLHAALVAAHAALDAAPSGRALIVIVTDGILPTDATGSSLAAPLAELPDVTVSSIILAPDALALPDPRKGALADLSQNLGGHVAAVRHAEATARAASLADEVGAVVDWGVTGIRAGDADIRLSLPDDVPAGGGVIAFGWYRGPTPTTLTLTVDDETLTAKRTKLAHVAALALAGGIEPLLPAMSDADAERARSTLARTIGAVSDRAALVVVDRRDELAAARLDLATKGGTFARIPPPPEDKVPVPVPRVSTVVDAGSRYLIDTATLIRADLLNPQLLPAVKRCYRDTLGHGGVSPGKILLEIEIARGEVGAVRIRGAHAPKRLTACLADAGYGLTVPTYTLTDGPDTIHLIRYPITYRASDDPDAGPVIGEDGQALEIDIGTTADTPLGNLTGD